MIQPQTCLNVADNSGAKKLPHPNFAVTDVMVMSGMLLLVLKMQRLTHCKEI